MREYEITDKTPLHTLLTGLRIRMQRSVVQLARQLNVPAARVLELETRPEAVREAPTGEFLAVMNALGVRLVAQAPWLSGSVSGLAPLISNDPEAQPVPQPVPAVSQHREVVYMRDTNSLPDTLRRLRRRTGKSQAQVCREMGVQQGTYSKHERDSVNVTMDFLALYANYFNVNFMIGVEDADADAA